MLQKMPLTGRSGENMFVSEKKTYPFGVSIDNQFKTKISPDAFFITSAVGLFMFFATVGESPGVALICLVVYLLVVFACLLKNILQKKEMNSSLNAASQHKKERAVLKLFCGEHFSMLDPFPSDDGTYLKDYESQDKHTFLGAYKKSLRIVFNQDLSSSGLGYGEYSIGYGKDGEDGREVISGKVVKNLNDLIDLIGLDAIRDYLDDHDGFDPEKFSA